MSRPWYRVDDVSHVLSPGLMVHRDRVRENIRRMIAMAGGTSRLRPHVKTHKMAEVVALQLTAGVDKFKCATIAEAEMVAESGGRDVFIAYQLVGPHTARLLRLMEAFPDVRFMTMVDDERVLRELSNVLGQSGRTAGVLLDIDNGLGRSGIRPDARAVALYRLMATLPGIEPAGLHVYDGHIRDRDRAERIAHVQADFEAVDRLHDQLARENLPAPRIVAGGTPTFAAHALRKDVETSPGTCIFWDAGYAGKFPDYEFLHAAVLLTRVVSKPGADRLCLDLGYKAVSPDNPDPRVELLDVPDARMMIHNEEHLTVETAKAGEFNVGDVLYGIPFHVCPTVALHREAVIVEDGQIVDRWKVRARDRVLSI